jgi:hypothetical protein
MKKWNGDELQNICSYCHRFKGIEPFHKVKSHLFHLDCPREVIPLQEWEVVFGKRGIILPQGEVKRLEELVSIDDN